MRLCPQRLLRAIIAQRERYPYAGGQRNPADDKRGRPAGVALARPQDRQLAAGTARGARQRPESIVDVLLVRGRDEGNRAPPILRFEEDATGKEHEPYLTVPIASNLQALRDRIES